MGDSVPSSQTAMAPSTPLLSTQGDASNTDHDDGGKCLDSEPGTPLSETATPTGSLTPATCSSSGISPSATMVSLLPVSPPSGTCTPRLIDMYNNPLSDSILFKATDSCSMILPNFSNYSNNNVDTKSNYSETNSAMIPICRICHMPGDTQEILISPCRCAGTLQFIHNTCLQKWLEISRKRSRKSAKCELCRYQFHRHKKFKFHHWRFPRISQQDKILHVIFIVNLIIMIGCAIATVMCFLSDKGQINKFPRNKVDLTTEEIITLSCGVLFFVSFFIAMSVQIKAKHTIYQLLVKFVMQNMEWEIDEYDKSKDSLYMNKDLYKCPAPPEYV